MRALHFAIATANLAGLRSCVPLSRDHACSPRPQCFFSMGIAVLSPAKTLDESPCPERTSGSDHPFAGRTATLLDVCKRLSKAQLKGLMGLSDALAKLNFDRFQAFEVSPMPRGTILVQSWQPTVCGRCAQAQAAKASAWAFDGPAHKAWAIDTLGKMEQEYAQSHVLTLSGLYGCLRPRDAIRPCALTAALTTGSRRPTVYVHVPAHSKGTVSRWELSWRQMPARRCTPSGGPSSPTRSPRASARCRVLPPIAAGRL